MGKRKTQPGPKAKTADGRRYPFRKRSTPLTQEAEFARDAWVKYSDKLGMTQREVSQKWGRSDSFVSQLVMGRIAFTADLKLKYSMLFGVLPQDIWPDWEYKEMTCGNIQGTEYRIILFIRSLNAARRAEVEEFVNCKLMEQAREVR
jgi:hypothetical protein